MPRKLEIQQEAEEEAREARIFYEDRDVRIAADFMRELDRTIEVVVDRPDRWPAVRQNAHSFLLRRFPFRIVYTFDDEVVRIIAVAHLRRRPGYWSSRI
jgi:plasmid stabilization system protein ParE